MKTGGIIGTKLNKSSKKTLAHVGERIKLQRKFSYEQLHKEEILRKQIGAYKRKAEAEYLERLNSHWQENKSQKEDNILKQCWNAFKYYCEYLLNKG